MKLGKKAIVFAVVVVAMICAMMVEVSAADAEWIAFDYGYYEKPQASEDVYTYYGDIVGIDEQQRIVVNGYINGCKDKTEITINSINGYGYGLLVDDYVALQFQFSDVGILQQDYNTLRKVVICDFFLMCSDNLNDINVDGAIKRQQMFIVTGITDGAFDIATDLALYWDEVTTEQPVSATSADNILFSSGQSSTPVNILGEARVLTMRADSRVIVIGADGIKTATGIPSDGATIDFNGREDNGIAYAYTLTDDCIVIASKTLLCDSIYYTFGGISLFDTVPPAIVYYLPIDATNFPDANLRLYVQTYIDTIDFPGRLSEAECAAVTEIVLNQKLVNSSQYGASAITSAKGIELFPNLETLVLGDDSGTTNYNFLVAGFETIDLSGNPKIKTIYLKAPSLTKLDLSSNPLLESVTLNCYSTVFSGSLNQTPSNRLTSIKFASVNIIKSFTLLGVGAITTFDLAPLPMLETLELELPNLSSLTFSGSTSLKNILIKQSSLATIDFHGVPSLVSLDLKSTALTSLNLNGNSELQVLNLTDANQLVSLDLANNTALQTLCLNSVNLKNMLLLGNKPMLTSIKLVNCYLSEIDLTGCPVLKTLFLLKVPNLRTLDLRSCLALEIFAYDGVTTTDPAWNTNTGTTPSMATLTDGNGVTWVYSSTYGWRFVYNNTYYPYSYYATYTGKSLTYGETASGYSDSTYTTFYFNGSGWTVSNTGSTGT